MSIRVSEITKQYGTQTALNKISFSVEKGEIVGFLGPNGAGKSTLMKILTTYISSDSGDAWVGENDVVQNPENVREVVGYLPEHNPLYLDLY
ncbi:MAG: ATP-binding cassette domain-containing protein, partial [Flavobacteriaceae bacterium]